MIMDEWHLLKHQTRKARSLRAVARISPGIRVLKDITALPLAMAKEQLVSLK